MRQWTVPAAKLTPDQVAFTAGIPTALTQAGNQFFVLMGANIARYRHELLPTIDWLVSLILEKLDTVRFPRPSGTGIQGTFLKASLVASAVGMKKTWTLVTSTDMTTHPLTDDNAIYVGVTSLAAPPTINYGPAMGANGFKGAAEAIKRYILEHQKASLATVVTVTPATASLVHPTGTQQLTAVATFADGSTTDVTAICVWASSAPLIASVNQPPGQQRGVGAAPAGLVTGLTAGSANVTAVYNGITSGACAVTVT